MAENILLQQKDIDRFWSKVDIRGPEDCWEWTAYRHPRGCGRFWMLRNQVNAHRAAWVISNGLIPENNSYHGICVLHKCDNPPCVNPNHLFLGTAADNNKDRANKGRNGNFKLSNNPAAKLKDSDIIEIRKLLGSSEQKVIASLYSVTAQTISDIKCGRRWSEIR